MGPRVVFAVDRPVAIKCLSAGTAVSLTLDAAEFPVDSYEVFFVEWAACFEIDMFVCGNPRQDFPSGEAHRILVDHQNDV